MKTVLQASICSIVIHLIYTLTILIIDYIKTKNFTPDISNAYENLEMLQSEVAFGQIVSPVFSIITFIAITLVCWKIILTVKRGA
ncbi:hypothetical protein [Ornithinibacillus scapharcae]|uniref:hypothetical protein n=1 Tax=Ornithinibacillus scapharcae TaxID=1147159 RepID=UPI000225B5E5|nr:hypothetical protein [Ornithinibacillus scapharcae]